MKLKKYSTLSDYETAKSDLKYPSVGLVEEDGSVLYMGYQNYFRLSFQTSSDFSLNVGLADKFETNGIEYTDQQTFPAGNYNVKFSTNKTTEYSYVFIPQIDSVDLASMSIDVSGIDSSKVTYVGWYDDNDEYEDSEGVPVLDLSKLDGNKLRLYTPIQWGGDIIFPSNFGAQYNSFEDMFYSKNYGRIIIDNAKTSHISNFAHCFNWFGGHSISLSHWDTSAATTMYYMFIDCKNLESIDISSFDTSNVETMYGMFCRNYALTSVVLPDNFGAQDMGWIFQDDSNLEAVDTSKIDVSRATDISGLFHGCAKITNIETAHWNTSNVTKMQSTFYGTGVSSLDLTHCDLSNVNNMSYCFGNCASLTEIRMKGSIESLSNNTDMFQNTTTTGVLYYDSAYDYSKILEALPSTWTSVAVTY